MDANTRAYFSNFSPASIYHTISNATTKLKEQYDLPSVNPLWYADPRNIRPYLHDPEGLRNVLRVVVVATVYLLFRPHLDRLIRKMSGAPDSRAEALKVRVAELRAREGGGAGGGGGGGGGGGKDRRNKGE